MTLIQNKNHPRRLWTWRNLEDRIRNQTDYIMISLRFRDSVISSKAFPGADCGSEYVQVICESRVKLKRLN